MTAAVTKEGIEVKIGQVWRDLDVRMNGRTVKVLAVYPDDGKVEVENRATGGRTKLLIRRMHKTSTGWSLAAAPAGGVK